jgi:hypothetical protein
MPQGDNYPYHTKSGDKLKPDDAVCLFQARQTICVSHLARKSDEFVRTIEVQESVHRSAEAAAFEKRQLLELVPS